MARLEATERGESTKGLIVNTALQLFREQGYERATMRAIAQRAGVSVGNAYYYFPSKVHLVQRFYQQIQDEHRTLAEQYFGTEKNFVLRARGVLYALLDVMAPYHEFAATFIKNAIEPRSALSPFSEESKTARDNSIAIWRKAIDGSSLKLGRELRVRLPELLWLGQMGVTLYWVHDNSIDQMKTRMLIDRTIPLIDRLIGFTRLPIFRSFTREILALLDSIQQSVSHNQQIQVSE